MTAACDLDHRARPGARSRFNAWFFATLAPYLDHAARPHRDHAFAGLRGQRGAHIVEIGPGVGANLAELPPDAHLTAIEPNRAMHDPLRRRADAHGIDLDLIATGAEAIPLPDASADAVIATLVLCSVHDPRAVLAEVHRVLRPDGTFRFVEHVAAPPRTPRAWLQRVLRRPWGWVFEGCDPHRHTADLVAAAGFRTVDLRRHRFRHSVFYPVNTAISGVAVR